MHICRCVHYQDTFFVTNKFIWLMTYRNLLDLLGDDVYFFFSVFIISVLQYLEIA